MPENTPITLALLEDQDLLRTTLALCMEHWVGYRLVLARPFAKEHGEELSVMEQPAIALVGYTTDGSGHGATDHLTRLRGQWPTTLLMLLTDRFDTHIVQSAVQAGCTGFACRLTTGFEQLKGAMQQLHTTGCCYPPEAVRALAQQTAVESELARIERLLNDTQLRILDAACAPDEPTWKVVAERVHRTESGIEWNVPRMFAVLGVKSKSGLVALGRKNGFGQGRWLNRPS
jgi:DNA-binding NarL/FixJ family response regulator